MKKIFLLALFFTKSFLRQKSTILFIILTLVFIIVSSTFINDSIAKSGKLLKDFLIFFQAFLLHLAALFYTFEFLQRKRNIGIFILPLATGLSRNKYLLSEHLGIWFFLGLISLGFMSIDLIFLYFQEDKINFLIFWQIILFTFSSMLFTTLMILFSQFFSIISSTIYSVLLYFLGNGLDELYYYANYFKIQSLQTAYEILYYIIPNFSLFDKQGIITRNANYEMMDMFVIPIFYIFISITVLLFISSFKFNKKALKVGL